VFIRHLFLGFFLLALSSCNTIEGMGEDIEDVGESLGDAAEENKNY